MLPNLQLIKSPGKTKTIIDVQNLINYAMIMGNMKFFEMLI